MAVGIVGGTGPAGRALGARLAAGGATVVLGSRDAARAQAAAAEISARWPALHLPITGAANEEAASQDIVVLATVWDAVVATAVQLSPQLTGRVVVSMANAITRVGGEFQALVPVRGSLAATIQAAVPGCRVTAAFHHLPAGRLGELDQPIEADVLVCADDDAAGEATVRLVESIPGLRACRAGSLASAGAVEALTAVLVNVNLRYRAHTTLHLRGLPAAGGGARR
jgi:NADPH-dependent F420 reductase